MKGKLFVISAPSGTGKTTIIKELLTRNKGLALSVSATTRPPRKGDVDGVDYHFISEERFQNMVSSGELLEHANVHGFHYGTPRAPVEKWIKEGRKVILDIDVQGALTVKKNLREAVLIFLLPPSREELLRRLKGRGTGESNIDERIKNADRELSLKERYDHQVVNDDIETAVRKVENIINA